MFRDVFDTPAGRRRVQQDASIRTILQTQLKNTIDFANRSSNLLDNTEFKAYIEDLLRRVNEYELRQKSKIQSRIQPRRTKKSHSQIQSRRSRSKSRIDK
jgi:3-phenylpropionate/cinnamic acid dioxygenase small subunit